jgi:hypothetical protein
MLYNNLMKYNIDFSIEVKKKMFNYINITSSPFSDGNYFFYDKKIFLKDESSLEYKIYNSIKNYLKDYRIKIFLKRK